MNSFTKQFFIFAIISTLLFTGIKVNSQEFPGTKKESKDTVLILPFEWGDSSTTKAISIRAAWLLQRKLRAGRYELPEVKNRVFKETAVTWENRGKLHEYFKLQKTKWLISGKIENTEVDPDGKWEGPKILGVAGIPLTGSMEIKIYNCRDGEDFWSARKKISGIVHRLRVFGINSSPVPTTPRAIDALIHNSIMELSKEMINKMNSTIRLNEDTKK